MNSAIASIFTGLGSDISNGAISLLTRYETILPFLKGASLLLSAFFIFGAIYSIVQSRYHHLVSDKWLDRFGSKAALTRRMRRLWNDTMRDIQSRTDRKKWVSAMKNAEDIMQEGLRMRGYRATSADERVRIAEETNELATIEEIRTAHEVYGEAKNEDSPFTHALAIETLKKYKKAIRELGVMGEGKF